MDIFLKPVCHFYLYTHWNTIDTRITFGTRDHNSCCFVVKRRHCSVTRQQTVPMRQTRPLLTVRTLFRLY